MNIFSNLFKLKEYIVIFILGNQLSELFGAWFQSFLADEVSINF